MKKNRVFLFLYIGIIGISGLLLILWITPFGSGLSSDSIVYLSGAKSLLSGKGLLIKGNLITNFPPLYPLLLAAVSLLESNFIQAARILNAILFGIIAGLCGYAVYISAGRNYLAASLAVLLFLSSAPILELYSMAWSEPLFITFSLTCLILLSLYVTRSTLFLFIASCLSLGLALLTRYIGLAFLPAALAVVFIGRAGQRPGRRLRDTLIWFVLAFAPLGIVFAVNRMLAGSAANRSIGFHPVSVFDYVHDLISVLFEFTVPITLPWPVKPAIFGLLAVFLFVQLIMIIKKYLRDINWRELNIVMPLTCLLFALSYLLFLFISISFIDAATPVDVRLLSPVIAILIVGLFSATWSISQIRHKPVVWSFFLLIVAFSILIKLPGVIQFAAAIQRNGLGYTSREWNDSESIAYVKSLAEDTKIYTNGWDVFGFLTGKEAMGIPAKINSSTMKVNPFYNEEMEAMCNEIAGNRAMLVYSDLITWRWDLPNRAEIEVTCQMPPLHRFADGTVYGATYR